jgi:predicted GIY-YIG superfamily endonuclease
MHYVYIVKCADGAYYTGTTHNLQKRIDEHNDGTYGGWTSHRRPVVLVWSDSAPDEHQAFLIERQIKGWSRAKKEALIANGVSAVPEAMKKSKHQHERRQDGSSGVVR